jgi:RNA polymerase sigma-70 factor (ECF subfamily)
MISVHPSGALDGAFESLYASNAPMIIRYLARLTGSHEAAEDLAQETFLKVLRHVGELNEAKNVRAWLFQIATNTAYDELRRWRRRTTTPLTETHANRLIASPVGLPVEEAELLWAVLAQLPDDYRIPLVLQGYAGYSVSDIAALLGRNVNTIRSRLQRARVQCKKLYALSAGS